MTTDIILSTQTGMVLSCSATSVLRCTYIFSESGAMTAHSNCKRVLIVTVCIAGGKMRHTALLWQFWPTFDACVQATKGVSGRDNVDILDTSLAAHLFVLSDKRTEAEARACPVCAQRAQQGRLGLKLSKSGGFIGCSNYPDCSYVRPLEVPQEDGMPSFSSPKDQESLEAFPALSEGACDSLYAG